MMRVPARFAMLLLASALLLAAGCARKPLTYGAWTALPLGTSADFRGLWFSDADHGWIAGGSFRIPGGIVGRTSDGGRTWKFKSGIAGTGMNHRFGAARFFDQRRGLVAGGGGEMFATTDGGDNWSLVPLSGCIDFLGSLQFVGADLGWSVGGRCVLRTEDGGAIWRQTRLKSNDLYTFVGGEAMHFIDADTGWLVGGSESLRYSDDGGFNWLPHPLPFAAGEHPKLHDIWFADAKHGWIVGDQGTILRTVDGGDTWTLRSSGVPDARSVAQPETFVHQGKKIEVDTGGRTPGLTLTAVRFVDANVGYAAGYYANLARSLILRTQDGGATWAVDADIPGDDLHALFVLDAGNVWAVGWRTREGTQMIYRRGV